MSTPIKQFQTVGLLDVQGSTGTSKTEFQVITGSRMLVSLNVIDMDPGVSVQMNIGNTFDLNDGYEIIETFTATAVGRLKAVLSDFHNQFEISVVVTGGAATYKLGVSIFDNAMTTRIDNAVVQVDLSDTPGVDGKFDAVRVGDGSGHYLKINTDGAINVVVEDALDENPKNIFNDVTAIASGDYRELVTYTVPGGLLGFLTRIEASGENIAQYDILINGTLVARKRTYFGSFNTVFEFTPGPKLGLPLNAADVISVKVLHDRPNPGNFEARIQVTEKG